MIEGLIATSFLVITAFGIIELAGYMRDNANLSRILQQAAVGVSTASSCTSLANVQYLPDSVESFSVLLPDIKNLITDLLRLNSLTPAEFVIDVELFADGVSAGGVNTIRTGYVWMGLKLANPTKILGLDDKLNCHTLLAPLPTSFDLENPADLPIITSPSLDTTSSCPTKIINHYQWAPVANSIAKSNAFCNPNPN